MRREKLPMSGREVTISPPDLFELVLRSDGSVPSPIMAAMQRLVIDSLVANGLASAEERAIAAEESDGEAAVALMRFLIEEGTSEPKLCSSIERARELRARGVEVDLQARYSQADLVWAYDRVMQRGGQLYRAWFPEAGAAESAAVPLESLPVAEGGPAAEPDAGLPAA